MRKIDEEIVEIREEEKKTFKILEIRFSLNSVGKKQPISRSISHRCEKLPLTVTLCSPVPGCVNRSICTDISPTLSSGFCESIRT